MSKSLSIRGKLDKHFLLVLLFFIVVLGFVLRAYRLSYKSMWGDEIFSVYFSGGSDWQRILWADPTHPLCPYYVILHFFLYSGQNEIVVRLPSVIFGVLSILLIYKVGKSFFGEEEGLISAFLLSISTMHIWHSQEARMYSLATLLSLLSLFLFYKAIKENDTKLWIGFVISTLLGLYTHFYMLFVPLIEIPLFVFMLYRNRSSITTRIWKVGRKKILLLVLGLIIVAILLFPLFQRTLHIIRTGTGFMAGWRLRPESFFVGLFGHFSAMGSGVWLWLSLFLFLSALLIGLLTSIKEYRQPVAFLLLWIFLPSTVIFILTSSLYRPIASAKYLIFILPGYLIGVSRGISSITSSLIKRLGFLSMPLQGRKQVVVGLMIAVVVFGGVSVVPLQHYYESEWTNWRAAAEYLETNPNPADIIVAPKGIQSLLYYYDENPQKNTTLVSTTFEKLLAANLSSVDAGLWLIVRPHACARVQGLKNWFTHNYFREIKRFTGIIILYRPKGLILVSTRVRFEQKNDSATFDVHLPTDANYTIAIRAISSNESTLELVVDGVSKSFRTFIAEKWSHIELGTFFLKPGSSKVMIINRSEPGVKIVFDKVAIWPTG